MERAGTGQNLANLGGRGGRRVPTAPLKEAIPRQYARERERDPGDPPELYN